MEKMQFNHFPIISLWEFFWEQPKQKAGHHIFIYF